MTYKIKATSAQQLEAITQLINLASHEDKEIEEDECQSDDQPSTDEYTVDTVPVVTTINSIIARSLMYIDSEELVLKPKDLLTLAKLNHVLQSLKK